MCWLSWRRNKLLKSMTEEGFANWSKVPTETEALPSHRNWEADMLPPLVSAFQKDGAQVFEETFLSCDIGESLI